MKRPASGICLATGMPKVTRILSRLASIRVWPLALLAGLALQPVRSTGHLMNARLLLGMARPAPSLVASAGLW